MNTATSSHDDAALLAACARQHRPTSVLDVGAGTGELLLGLAAQRPTPALHGIDVDAAALHVAHERLVGAAPHARLQLIHADATTHPLPRVRLACINPPLLPGETGFTGLDGDLFWHTMLRRLATEPFADVALLHLFGFHGLTTPTGSFPSLHATLALYGLQATRTYSGTRRIGPDSRIRRAMPDLQQAFPQGTIYVQGVRRQLKDLPPSPSAPLAIEHYVYTIGAPVNPRVHLHPLGRAHIGT
jgi:hypothetical protein